MERLKALCKKLGLKVPQEAIQHVVREVPPPEAEPLHFPSIKQQQREQQQQQETEAASQVEPSKRPLEEEEVDVKPDIKRMATQKHGEKGLLKQFVGQVDDKVIVTHVQAGTDPLQQYHEDDPEEMVVLDMSTDEEIDYADDLSEVSLVSQGNVTHAELSSLLMGISSAHKQMATAVDTLQERVQDMTLEQVDDTAAAISSELANVRGLDFVTGVFDQEEIALILAVGVRRLQEEWQVLMGKRKKNDITSYARLQEIFGCNARTISECGEGKKCRYTRSTTGKPEATKQIVRYEHTQYTEQQKEEAEPGMSAETPAPE